MTAAPRVEVRIRRLVWEGAGPPSRSALCAAVEAELATLLAGSPAGPAVPADPALTAHARRIARAVHEALGAARPSAPECRTPRTLRAPRTAATASGSRPQEGVPSP